MANRGNGKTIKIPVRRVDRQLPIEPANPPLLLTASQWDRQEVVEALPEVQDKSVAEATSGAPESPPRPMGRDNDVAELQKRFERRKSFQISEERRRLLRRMLTVADNLDRALVHADHSDPLRDGVQLTLDDLIRQLAQEGVEPIRSLGQPFDPTLHEAVATDGLGGDTVIEVLQTGYSLDGGLLRPARVVVGSLK